MTHSPLFVRARKVNKGTGAYFGRPQQAQVRMPAPAIPQGVGGGGVGACAPRGPVVTQNCVPGLSPGQPTSLATTISASVAAGQAGSVTLTVPEKFCPTSFEVPASISANVRIDSITPGNGGAEMLPNAQAMLGDFFSSSRNDKGCEIVGCCVGQNKVITVSFTNIHASAAVIFQGLFWGTVAA